MNLDDALLEEAKRATGLTERGALLRAGVALLYAHWEGFVRHAAQSYLELVADRVKRGRLGYHELAPPFAGLAMLRRLRETAPAGQRALLAEATRILRASPCESASIPTADIVSARSNLSFAVLTQLLAAIGIDTAPHATKRYIIDEGLLKLMSKMGISTVRSYHGSGLFESLGLGRELVDAYFPGTPAPLSGIGLAEIAEVLVERERLAAEADAVLASNGHSLNRRRSVAGRAVGNAPSLRKAPVSTRRCVRSAPMLMSWERRKTKATPPVNSLVAAHGESLSGSVRP